MPTYTQANRQLVLTTPLGTDKLLLEKITGFEALSEPFVFRLQMVAASDTTINFDAILGQAVNVEVKAPGLDSRFFHGIVRQFTQLQRIDGIFGSNSLIRYEAEIVPKIWLLTRKFQSRIFQQKSVSDILKLVLTGYTVTYKLEGTYDPRDYCTQYRESDFDFMSRLMEEEGIYYYFKHTDGSHEMVVADTPNGFYDLAKKEVSYDEYFGEVRDEERIFSWVKSQEIRSGKVTLWDYHFETADSPYKPTKPVLESVSIGDGTQKLKVANNDQLEIYDFPGAFAQRYDGVDKGGGDQASQISKITPDGDRTAQIRMQQETVQALRLEGASNSRPFSAGGKFTLKDHYNTSGTFVLTRIEHEASVGGTYTTTGSETFSYGNRFLCLPSGLPFRPVRKTPKARVEGTQTAVVVGPAGEEIFVDKYSRVKVQFHWDREGQKNADSSCWVRVATLWAGKQWGAIHIPRIGQEVVVAYEEGDPDQPIIVGSVYNASNMPPYTLPDNKTQSGLKSRSSLQGTEEFFNELRFEDKKDAEDIYFHAQKDFHRVVENDDDLKVGRHQTNFIQNNRTETIKEGNETLTIEKGHRSDTLKEGEDSLTLEMGNKIVLLQQGNYQLTLSKGNFVLAMTQGNRTATLDDGDDNLTIAKGNRNTSIKTDDNLKIEGKQTAEITGNQTLTIKQGNQEITISSGNMTTKTSAGGITIEAATGIELKVGGSSIKISPSGVTIQATMVKIEGQGMLQAKSPMTQVNGSGMLELKGGVVMVG